MNGQHNENGPTSRGNDNAGPGTNRLEEEGGLSLMSDSIHTTTDSTFEPGNGWREVQSGEQPGGEQPGAERIIWSSAGSHNPDRVWVREQPVPALPTDPWTVIRVTWRAGHPRLRHDELTLHRSIWRDTSDGGWLATQIHDAITSFEVLSEPRAVTAKAVLDRVMITGISGPVVGDLYRGFGVES